MPARRNEGIQVRHARGCPGRDDGRCRCAPRYQAQVWSPREHKRISRTFPTLAAAKSWRHDAAVALHQGTLQAGHGRTIQQAWDEWEGAAKSGLVMNRSGDPYKPSALRGYEQAMRLRVLPVLGPEKLNDIRRSDVQRLVNRMMAQGVKPSTIRNALMPLRAIYRYALTLDEVGVNPTTGIQLPAVRGRRERIASPTEAASLIAALPPADQAVWATAMYAGLRAGELQALPDELIDLERNVIRVHWSWDPRPEGSRQEPGRPAHRADPEDPAPPPGRAPPRPPRPRRPVLRPHDRPAVLQPGPQPARRARLGGSEARADRPAQVSTHIRITDDRRRSQRQGAVDVHGSRVDHDHPRPLRPPVPRL